MEQYKIIFTGPVGAGKTTAINALSDIPTVKTDVRASDTTAMHKKRTTVALDYGRINLDSGERIHLYGTPGQERFDFMWEILTEGGIGLILLLDNTRQDPFQDMRSFSKGFGSSFEIRRSPLALLAWTCAAVLLSGITIKRCTEPG